MTDQKLRRTFPFLFLLLLFLVPADARAQIRDGTVHGVVRDPAGGVVPNARVELVAAEEEETVRDTQLTAADGTFRFRHVPQGDFRLDVNAPGFATASYDVAVRSNLPVQVEVALRVGNVTDVVDVTETASAPEPANATRLDAARIEMAPTTTVGRALGDLVSLTPGVTIQHNGLMHVRGIEDGLLYVVNGVPLGDRLDALHATGFDTEGIDGLEVMAGHMPAEFGGRNAAVVAVEFRSPLERPRASVSLGAGTERTRDVTAAGSLKLSDRVGVSGSIGASSTDRLLDPPDERNFNNHGGRISIVSGLEWRPQTADALQVRGFVNGTNLRVPNDAEQEAAGQHQRQELRDGSASGAWQRVWNDRTVTDIATFHDRRASRLQSSLFDTPIAADGDRAHRRLGAIVSLTHALGQHVIKAGFQADRTTVREWFSFATTDPELAEEREVSEAALEFDRDNPFVFEGRDAGVAAAAYVQDTVSLRPDVTVSLGLRVDRSALPEAEWQVSPRAGAAWALANGRTVLRASADRLFMPPQIENLLLANSEEARKLSPFADDDEPGGLGVRPERVWAFEAGISQRIGRAATLDVAQWARRITDAADPNVFFNTTIVFPNSVAKGESSGTDVRLTVPWRQWTARVAYTYARVEHEGPITGGLFLTEEFEEIGPGTRFTPDHDQRHTATAAVTYRSPDARWWVSAAARHQSGVPLEVEDEALERLSRLPGADLVNFETERVKPWTLVDAAFSTSLPAELFSAATLRVDVQNLFDRRFAFNFGSPFEGTHFGYTRRWRVGVDVRW